MNDLNSVSPVPQNTAAPLKHDIEGRFSRHGIPNKENPLKKAFMENAIISNSRSFSDFTGLFGIFIAHSLFGAF